MTFFTYPQRYKTVLYRVSFLLLPFLFGFSLNILDDIQIAAIRSMQLQEVEGKYVLDTVIDIHNTSSTALKLRNCKFRIFLALDDVGDIPLGVAHIDEIVLPPHADSSETAATMELSVELESDIEEFQTRLFSSKEIVSLMIADEPGLPLKIQGTFDFGMRTAQAWSYKEGMKIDWIVSPAIQKQVLLQVVSSMSSDETVAAISSTLAESSSIPPDLLHAEDMLPAENAAEGAAAPLAVASENDAGAASPDEIERLYPLTVHFSSGSMKLNRTSKKDLKEWAAQLHGGTDEMILHIAGHTDKTGELQKNQEVSIRRTGAVFHYLISTLNITQYRVYCIEGFAARQPVIDDDTAEANEQNRRVELFFVENN